MATTYKSSLPQNVFRLDIKIRRLSLGLQCWVLSCCAQMSDKASHRKMENEELEMMIVSVSYQKMVSVVSASQVPLSVVEIEFVGSQLDHHGKEREESEIEGGVRWLVVLNDPRMPSASLPHSQGLYLLTKILSQAEEPQ